CGARAEASGTSAMPGWAALAVDVPGARSSQGEALPGQARAGAAGLRGPALAEHLVLRRQAPRGTRGRWRAAQGHSAWAPENVAVLLQEAGAPDSVIRQALGHGSRGVRDL